MHIVCNHILHNAIIICAAVINWAQVALSLLMRINQHSLLLIVPSVSRTCASGTSMEKNLVWRSVTGRSASSKLSISSICTSPGSRWMWSSYALTISQGEQCCQRHENLAAALLQHAAGDLAHYGFGIRQQHCRLSPGLEPSSIHLRRKERSVDETQTQTS